MIHRQIRRMTTHRRPAFPDRRPEVLDHLGSALEAALDAEDLSEDLALAVRAHRRELGMSQRAYAAHRGISRNRITLIESGHARRVALSAVEDTLEPTPYRLMVVLRGDLTESEQATLAELRPTGSVPAVELVARDSNRRRLPAHLPLEPGPVRPPTWWFARNGGWSTMRTYPLWRYRMPPPASAAEPSAAEPRAAEPSAAEPSAAESSGVSPTAEFQNASHINPPLLPPEPA